MITIWRLSLDHPDARRPERADVLDAAERTRAARFKFAHDAARWTAAHVALRECLAEASNLPPEVLEFAVEADGKPYLRHEGAPAFNLSHSDGHALLAVGGAEPLGVDIEVLRPVPEMVGVAESHFAEDERRALFALPEDERLAGFYRIWTRKEAYVKATGIGIGPALARFSVTIDPQRAALLRDDSDPAALTRWTLRDLALDAPCVGALVSHAPAQPLMLRHWP